LRACDTYWLLYYTMTLTLFTVKVIDRKESEKRQNVKDEDRNK